MTSSKANSSLEGLRILNRGARPRRLSYSLRTKAGADMNKLFSWLGIAMMIFLPARMIWTHGERWEFSSHGIPVALLSPDGETYRNGDEIDPITLGMIRGGIEERVAACILLTLFAATAWCIYEALKLRQAIQSQARREGREAVLEMAKGYEREGKMQEAKAAFDYYRRLEDEEMELWLRNPSLRRELDKAMERLGISR